jgi:hypothetical protein
MKPVHAGGGQTKDVAALIVGRCGEGLPRRAVRSCNEHSGEADVAAEYRAADLMLRRTLGQGRLAKRPAFDSRAVLLLVMLIPVSLL